MDITSIREQFPFLKEKVNGHDLLDTPIATALASAGAYSTPKGLRIRA